MSNVVAWVLAVAVALGVAAWFFLSGASLSPPKIPPAVGPIVTTRSGRGAF